MSVPDGIRLNPAGIQMLSGSLRRQLFGDAPPAPIPRHMLEESRATLRQHGLEGKRGDIQPAVDLPLPPLQGGNVEEHFLAIGRAVAEPYLALSTALAGATLPPVPTTWRIAPGWTRYTPDAPAGVPVDVRAQ